MTLLLGVVLLSLSLFFIMTLRIALNRLETPRWMISGFFTDFAALTITALSAMGVALICSAAIEDWGPAMAAELAAAVLALFALSGAGWKLLRQVYRGTLRLDGDAQDKVVRFPETNQDGNPRPSGTSGRVKKAA